jgi:hypothetical protein
MRDTSPNRAFRPATLTQVIVSSYTNTGEKSAEDVLSV